MRTCTPVGLPVSGSLDRAVRARLCWWKTSMAQTYWPGWLNLVRLVGWFWWVSG